MWYQYKQEIARLLPPVLGRVLLKPSFDVLVGLSAGGCFLFWGAFFTLAPQLCGIKNITFLAFRKCSINAIYNWLMPLLS